LSIPHISTGDLFRANVAGKTELGLQVQEIMNSGGLVPDEITNAMVEKRLQEPDAKDGFILDGFPRNVGQADVLAALLAAKGEKIDAIVEFKVEEDVVVARLVQRGIELGRSDDTEEVIRHRQQVYAKETAPLLDYYGREVVTINADDEIAEVNKHTLRALAELKK
jgi:adenylate kinase